MCNISREIAIENSTPISGNNISYQIYLRGYPSVLDIYSLANESFTKNPSTLLHSDSGNYSELNFAKYVIKFLGPKGDKFTLAVIMTIIYVVIFLSGVFGNLCTTIVIVKSVYMRNITNYYLVSLALSDTLALVFGK